MSRIVNDRNQNVLVTELERADSFTTKLVGLMGRTGLSDGHGLWLRTNSVHTWFMKFTIDVVFVDGNGVVRGLVPNMKPWRLVLPVLRAKACLELPAGTLARTDTRKGDKLRVET